MSSPASGDSAAGSDGLLGTTMVTASQLRGLVAMRDAVEVVAKALEHRHEAGLSVAPRASLDGGRTLLMGASAPARDGLAAKVVSIVPENRIAGRATIQGVAVFFDWTTMRPVLVTDATALTALRTGALSGVATRNLALDAARVLAMIGAGGQALSLVEAVCLVRPIETVRIVSRRRETADALCKELTVRLPRISVFVVDNVADAVRDADVVCTATMSTFPLLEADQLKPGVHVNAVGAYRSDLRELDPSVFSAAGLVCVDGLEGALREAGDLIDALCVGAITRGQLVELGGPGADRPMPGRTTVFKSVGTAVADLAVLELLAQRAAGDENLCRVDLQA